MLGFARKSSTESTPTTERVHDGYSATVKDGGISTLVVTKSHNEQTSLMSANGPRPIDEPVDVVPPGRATTWKEAHRAYCMGHGTVRASVRDVLNEACAEGTEIPWELPRRGMSLIGASEVADVLKQADSVHSPATDTTAGASKASWMSLIVRSFIFAAGKDEGDDSDEWVQEQDDAFLGEDIGGSSSSTPDLDVPIVNFEMTRSALEELRVIIRQQSTDASPHILMGRSDWHQWISSATTEDDERYPTLSKLSRADTDFLLQVLVAMKEAMIIFRQRDTGLVDLIVLSPSAMTDQVESTKDTIPQHLQVQVALWDISKIEQRIEKQIDGWSERVAECNVNALKYKRKNQKSLALNQLAKRNVIQQRIDSSSMALIKLEQLKSAIETAQSNKMVLEHMRASTIVLKDLRLQVPLDEIEDIKDEWQSEYDRLQETHESLSAVGNAAGNMYDDDELLKELETLTDEKESTSAGNPPPPQPPGIDEDIANLEKRLAGLGGLGSSVPDEEKRFQMASLPS